MDADRQPVVVAASQAYKVDVAAALREAREADHGPTGRLTRVLVTLPGLRVVLVSMRAGSEWKQHSTPGRITVQALAGHIRMRFANGEFDLCPGEVAAFAAGVPHDVTADEDSAFLLTVARPQLD